MKRIKYTGLLLFLITALLTSAGYSFSTDINKDGIVDFYDFAILSSNWLVATEDQNDLVASAKFEIIADTANALTFVRDSNVVDSNFVLLDENVFRNEDICVASHPEMVVASAGPSMYIGGVDGNSVLGYRNRRFYKFTPEEFDDGNGLPDDMVPEFTIDSHPDLAPYYRLNDAIQSFAIGDDGSWFIAIHSSARNQDGYIFYSTNQGQDWTPAREHATGQVLMIEQGFPTWFSWDGIDEAEMLIGSYGASYQNNPPRALYYSDDYGRTWSKIFDPMPNPIGNPSNVFGMHLHTVCFGKDTNTIYISYGDPASLFSPLDRSMIVKLSCPLGSDKHDPLNWSIQILSQYMDNPTGWFRDGNYIYVGKDTGHLPMLRRINFETDKFEDLLWVNQRAETIDSIPYYQHVQSGACFDFFKYEGVIYACCQDFPITADNYYYNSAIYASADGINWTAIARDENHRGFANIVGYLDGYLWGYFREGDTKKPYRPFRIEPVNAATVQAICAQQAAKNQFTEHGYGYFKNGEGGDWRNYNFDWRPYDLDDGKIDLDFVGTTTEQKRYGTHSYQLRPKYKDGSYPLASLVSGRAPEFPKAGQYICASFYIKAGPNWPDCIYINGAIINAEIIGGYIPVVNNAKMQLSKNDWRRVIIWSQVLEDSPGSLRFTKNPRIIVPFDYSYYVTTVLGLGPEDDGVILEDAVAYIDCVQITYHDNMWDSSDWQPGDIITSEEEVIVPFADLGKSFTYSFVWNPKYSSRELKTDLPVATLQSIGNDYLELYYDEAGKRFSLSDGNSIIVSDPVSWEFHDSVKFAITTNGIETLLYSETVLEGLDISYDTSSPVIMRPPLCLKLSVNHDFTDHGIGRYTLIRAWDEQLTEEEITAVFSNPYISEQ